VLSIFGEASSLIDTVLDLARSVVREIDLDAHHGVHPRLGALDVVPFVPVGSATMLDAVAARDRCAQRLAAELALPVFLYGPLPDGSERSLPALRRAAREGTPPDVLPPRPAAHAGAVAVGARGALVAWNLWLTNTSLARTRELARAVRSADVRTLAFEVAGATQVSCNLIRPTLVTPADVYDAIVAQLTGAEAVLRAELVGLAPRAMLERIGEERVASLDLSEETTIEAALERLGLEAR
jgi:glutamate formiminotransferase